MTDVALATCAGLPGLCRDDRPLLGALELLGVSVEPVVWEDPHYPWRSVGVCVMRSVWDYAFRRGTFLAWAARVAETVPLWNNLDLVRWNTHKSYLLDLASRGVPIVPTVLLRRGTSVSLTTLYAQQGWDAIVIKGAVAQSGRYAMLARRDAMAVGQAHLDRLLPHEDMLAQPYVETVVTDGELSVTLIDGEITHAVRKRSEGDDFRVHVDYGGIEERCELADDERRVVLGAVDKLSAPTMYARVDLVRDAEGKPVIMELEVVEPDLFLRHAPEAVDVFARAIVRKLGR